jgi:hypothetical protein
MAVKARNVQEQVIVLLCFAIDRFGEVRGLSIILVEAHCRNW